MCIDTDNVFLLSYLADKLKGECIAYFKQHVLSATFWGIWSTVIIAPEIQKAIIMIMFMVQLHPGESLREATRS